MSKPELKVRRRNLPHWEVDGSVYFITFRLISGELNPSERSIVFEHIREGNEKFYQLICLVVMPDHVHLLLNLVPKYSLSDVMKGIKGVSSRKLNQFKATTGSNWQDESYDRITRNSNELTEKLTYMANNPVKSGLVKQIEDYPYFYCDKEAI